MDPGLDDLLLPALAMMASRASDTTRVKVGSKRIKEALEPAPSTVLSNSTLEKSLKKGRANGCGTTPISGVFLSARRAVPMAPPETL